MQMLGDQVTQNPVVVGDIYIHLYCGQYALMSRQDLGPGSSPWTQTDAVKKLLRILIKDKYIF